VQEKPTKTLPTKPAKNHRAGHLARLRAQSRKAGPDSVQDHELLELILFRDIPRRDVKDLAHLLIDHFGDLSAALAAPRDDLLAIPGVGEGVADDFLVVRAAALRFGQSKILHKHALANWQDLVIYCRTKNGREPDRRISRAVSR
jgi:DNA repair protein RadC